ncbi:hypothetical protein I547_4500 [Mycobacterium kansasii 824]|nr:hypothetical protein I547_4500 [Mycobacterium kansasii 824]
MFRADSAAAVTTTAAAGLFKHTGGNATRATVLSVGAGRAGPPPLPIPGLAAG